MGLLILHKMGLETAVGSDTFTAKIEITLRGKVEAPGICLVRAWADDEELRKQGKEWTDTRKKWALARIEDGNGRVLVEGRYLFIRGGKVYKL